MNFAHASFSGIIGYAQADITPPAGIYARNWGAAAHDVAKGIHYPLHARVLSMQSHKDQAPLFLISLDLGWWKLPKDEWLVRGALLQEFNLNESQVLINLTHTHAGPVFCSEDADKPGGELIAPYLCNLRDAVLEAAHQALAKSTFATLEWESGVCDLARNRDLPDLCSARIACGFNPATPADTTLIVGRVTDSAGKLRCILANYACHATSLAWQNALISPDWLCGYYQTIEQMLDVPAMFLQGASGELQPRDAYTDDVQIAASQGRQFAYSVLATLEGMLPPRLQLTYKDVVESGAPLAVWERQSRNANSHLQSMQIPLELPLKNLKTTTELQQELATCKDRVWRERIQRDIRKRSMTGDGKSTFITIWIWEIGDALLVAHREEAYSIFQQNLRNTFPQKTIIVMNLTNGSCGYLPPAALYDQNIYQVWQTPYAQGSAELMQQTVEDFLAQYLNSTK